MSEDNFKNPFIRNTTEYKRNLNVLQNYAKDTAMYLHLQTGKPIEVCKEFVGKSLAKGGVFEFKDPEVECLVRKDNGDREKIVTTLNSYLNEAISNKELISPTLTTYIHPDNNTSLLSLYIDDNVKARSRAKKEMYAAEAAGDKLLEAQKKTEQKNKKISNNSISGAHVSPSTPLYNPTAHSTLTSNCRSTSGYGNANNEKFLAGNRHYWSHHIVLNNIVSIVSNTNYDELNKVINKYSIHIPTYEETIECIKISSKLYWWEEIYFRKIENLVEKLTPLQRAAFVYTGDFYHLKKLNNDLVREFIKRLSSKVVATSDNANKIIKNAEEDILNLAHQICLKETSDIGKKYETIIDKQEYQTLACTVSNIEKTIVDYSDLIKVFWITTNVPASMAYFPESIRKVVITGDTDSTIFTVQDWVLWYKGKLSFDDESMAVAATLIFLTSSTIGHILAIMSANFGISEKRLYQIKMKNEFKFDVFIGTSIGKHYFATISAQEGNIYSKRKTEIKGVGLKSSNAPKIIVKKATNMMQEIMADVIEKGSISLNKYLNQISKIEKEIVSSIQRGESTYLRLGNIKDAESYTKEEHLSPYQNHHLWNKCFGPYYMEMPDPPYATTKFSLTTDTPAKFKVWLESLNNKEFAKGIESYMLENNKKYISTLNVPSFALETKGFPIELIDIIDYKKIVMDICSMFYLIIESLGVFVNGDKVKRLISDYY